MDHLIRDEYPATDEYPPIRDSVQVGQIDENKRRFLKIAGITTIGLLATPAIQTIRSSINAFEGEDEMIRFSASVKNTFNEIGLIRTNLGFPIGHKLSDAARYLKDNVSTNFIGQRDFERKHISSTSQTPWYYPKALLAEENKYRDLDLQIAQNTSNAVFGKLNNIIVKNIIRHPTSDEKFYFDVTNGTLILPFIRNPSINESLDIPEIRKEFINTLAHEFGHAIDPDGANIYQEFPSLSVLKMSACKWNVLKHSKEIPNMFLNNTKNEVYFYSIQPAIGDEFIKEIQKVHGIGNILKGDEETINYINGILSRYIPEIFEDNDNARNMKTIIGDEINDAMISKKIRIINEDFSRAYKRLFISSLSSVYQEVFAEMVRVSLTEPEKLENSENGLLILENIQEMFRILSGNKKLTLKEIEKRLHTS
jgi:hypothetical protein